MAQPRISQMDLLVRAAQQQARANDRIQYPNGKTYEPSSPKTVAENITANLKLATEPKKRSKGGNTKCEWKGIKFDSFVERDRYIELTYMQDAGIIRNLRKAPKYVLIPPVFLEGKNFPQTTYSADSYYEIVETGAKIVEDVKGYDVTDMFQHKRKQMKHMFDIEVVIWRKSGDSRGNTTKRKKGN